VACKQLLRSTKGQSLFDGHTASIWRQCAFEHCVGLVEGVPNEFTLRIVRAQYASTVLSAVV
jgi:hypothetical protein